MAPIQKILIGSSLRQDPLVLKYHLSTLQNLEIPDGFEVEFVFVDDDDTNDLADIVYEILPGAQILPTDPRPDTAIYNINSKTHNWNEETFDHLAKQKQKLLDHTVNEGFSHAFLVDSDILLGPRTLKSLLSTKHTLVSAVFWTQWQKGNANTLGPNVWLGNPYQQHGMGLTQGQFWKKLIDRKFTKVYGGGACHVIHRSALEKGIRYFPRLQGLPPDGMWQGEDRTFAILAFQQHHHQFADPWPDLFHAYHPDLRTDEVLSLAFSRLQGPLQKYTKLGDLVSFTVESLEGLKPSDQKNHHSEVMLKDAIIPVRGRLGGLDLTPDLEELLLDLPIGESAVHSLKYPFWWPVNANQERTVRVTLLDAKPNLLPPVVDEFMETQRGR